MHILETLTAGECALSLRYDPDKELHMLIVRISGVVALKASILGKVIAPVMAAVRVCSILKINELHGSQISHCSSLLYSLHKPKPLILLLIYNRVCIVSMYVNACLSSLQAKWLRTDFHLSLL